MHSIAKRCTYTPFCDWLTITTPESESFDLDRSLRPFLLAAGATPRAWGFSFEPFGSVAVKATHQVMVWSFSGEAIEVLKGADLWGAVLAEIGAHPHRVTRLDVAFDTDDDAPELLPSIEARGHRGELRLSRKSIPGGSIKAVRSLGPCGRLSGTVYVGKRGKARAFARVYDKRAHVVSLGFDDPGVPWTRYELQLAIPGISLNDAYAPASVFWAYGAELVERPAPADVAPWEGHGQGYVLPPRRERSAYEALSTRVENCAELDALRELADSLGDPAGPMALRRMVLQKLGLEVWARESENLTAVAQ